MKLDDPAFEYNESHSDGAGLRTRRAFLRTALLGTAASWTVPAFIEKTFGALDAAAAANPLGVATGKDATILVVLQLAGGNDGLNSVIPFADDAYYRARPTLGIKPGSVLRLGDRIGLHPKLAGLRALFDAGHLAVVQGVGYPNPNRSHFRSTEIWQRACDADSNLNTGWLGRYFDNACPGSDPAVGVAIGSVAPESFASTNPRGIVFARPEQYRWIHGDKAGDRLFRELNRTDDFEMDASADGSSIGMIGGAAAPPPGGELDFLRRTAMDAQVSSDKIIEIAKRYKGGVEYPQNQIGTSLALVARMIGGGLTTRVYYVSQGGYDTHTNQAGTHERLMGELDAALAAFCSDLKKQGNFGRVTLATFSEFGRRVAENGNAGTDHGAAAPLFVLGGAIKPGIHGTAPSLDRLTDGDLIHTVDFRSVYGTLLEHWLGAKQEPVLGRPFPKIAFL